MSTKVCSGIFLFSFANNSRSKQNLKNPEYPLADIRKWETCVKFQRKNFNSMVVDIPQIFNFSEKIPGFSKTMELCLSFCMAFSFTWLVLSNYKKNQSLKHNFIVTTRATLRAPFSQNTFGWLSLAVQCIQYITN